MSPSFETARFFATYGREGDPIGIIGVFHRCKLEKHCAITDLSRHPFAQRPRNQLAFAARPGRGIIDLKSPGCDSLFTSKWYKFRKSDEDLKFASSHVTSAYPTENEIAYFFSWDLDDFFMSHLAYQKMTQEQRLLVQEKLNSIRNQLKKVVAG